MSIDPKIWGPHFWFTMYSVAFTYPDNPTNNDINNFKNFYLSLGEVLPCPKCRMHYTQYINNHPLDNNILSKRNNLLDWLINYNNEVNKVSGNNKVVTRDSLVAEYIVKLDYGEKTETKKNKSKIIHKDIVLMVILPLSLIFIILLNKKFIIKNKI